MSSYLLVLLVAAGVTYLATPLARWVAEQAGAVTALRDRDVHTVATPRLGGVAMFVGLAVSMLVASQAVFFGGVFDSVQSPWGVVVSAGLVCVVGVIDDIWGLDWVTKLAGQVLAAGLLTWQGIQIVSLPLGGSLAVGSGGMFALLTVLAVVITINAVNFIDGLDGLAAGVMAVGSAAFLVYTYLLTRQASPFDYSSLAALIAAALVGACLGFLPHNMHPARIFMGDSGSMQLGLLISASAIAATGQVDPAQVSESQLIPAFLPVLLPVAVLMLPLLDLVLAVVRRMGKGQSPFAPDRLHLHHRLLDLGHSHARAVTVMCLWTAVVSFGAVATAFVSWQVWLPMWGTAVVLSVLITVLPLRRRRARADTGDGAGAQVRADAEQAGR